MTKFLCIASVALLAVASPANAANFTLADFSISVRSSDPGLVIFHDQHLATPQPFALDGVGDSETFTLFRIGTTEKALNGDDLIPYDIQVNFSFSEPQPAFEGPASGITGAGWFFGDFGYVAWNNPTVLQFGNYGLLGVTLENATFGLPGSTLIDATFTLLRADGGTPPRAVPEPSSAALLGLGGVAVAAIRRRRRPLI